MRGSPAASPIKSSLIAAATLFCEIRNPEPQENTALNLPSIEGPGRLGLDMALSKRIRIGETKSSTIRADAINF
jgi:hypothetical protein